MSSPRKRMRAILLSLLMVLSVTGGTVALAGSAAGQEAAPSDTGQSALRVTGSGQGSSPVAQQQNLTVADASPGTIFQTLLPGGDQNASEPIGLLKRGQSGGLLYNPSTALVVLEPGDVLVARDGTQYEVTQQQRLEGSTGFVGPGATVFQAEEVTFSVGFTTETLTGLPNQGAEGQTLDLNQTIDQNQEPGVYADPDGNTLTVQQPRVSRLQLLNSNGNQLTPGGEIRQDEFMIVQADVNYLGAERAEMNLIDPRTGNELKTGIINKTQALNEFPDRADVINANVPDGSTDRVSPDQADRSIANPQTPTRGTIYMIYDMQQVTKPGDYVFEIQTEDDDPFRDLLKIPVRRTQDFSLVAEDEPVMNFLRPELTAVQGEFVDYQVERSTIGEFHVVSIGADQLRGGGLSGNVTVDQATQVFRETGDGGVIRGVLLQDGTVIVNDGRVFEDGQLTGNVTPEVQGNQVTDVFTVLQVDNDGLATNQIDAGFLDDTNVNINLYPGSPSAAQAISNYEDADARGFINQVSLRVFQGGESLAVTQPGQTYVAGDDVDVEGTADPAIDFVSVYARAAGEDWQLIEPSLRRVPTRSDGTWSVPNVVLSQESEVLTVPGQWRIGVIDSVDADANGDGTPDSILTNTEFTRGASYQRGIRVIGQDLTGGFRTWNGQIAVEDGTVNVTGTNPGGQEVLYIFVGNRGNNIVQRDAVDQEWEYRNRNVQLVDEDGPLQQGTVVSFVLSPARDGVFGGAKGTRTPQEFVQYVEGLEDEGLTQEQTVQRIREASTADQGSDDLEVVQQWEFTRSSTTVDTIRPAGMNMTGINQIEPGETMVISGVTNLRADDNVIVADMREGPDEALFDVVSAQTWPTSGRYEIEMDVPEEVRPGSYVLRVDDGDNIITVPIEIVEQREQPTTTTTSTTTTTTSTTTTTTPTTTTTTPTTTTTTATTTTTTTTEQPTPGFTAVAGVAALLLAAALLALRRRNR